MLPRSRDHDHDCHRKLHATHHHKLECIVEHRGIRTFLVDDREYLVHVGLEELRLHVLLTRHHLVDVSADRVDLTVVNDETVRMSTHPARIRVRTETGVNRCDCRLVIRILKILKEESQLFYKEHTLVYNRSTAQRYDIGVIITLLKHTAGNIETTVKVKSLLHVCRLSDKSLHDVRHLCDCLVTDQFRMSREITPAEELESLFLDDDLEHLFRLISRKLVLREEEHADAILALSTELDSERFCHLLKKFVGNLKHDSDTITCLALRVFSGAVLKVFHDVKCLVYCSMGLNAFDIGNCSDTTVVMLKSGIVKTRSLCLCSLIALHCSIPFRVRLSVRLGDIREMLLVILDNGTHSWG